MADDEFRFHHGDGKTVMIVVFFAAGVSRRLQGTILFYIHGGLVRHSRADKPLRQVPVDLLAVAPLISRRG